MSVRAKFKVTSVEAQQYTRNIGKDASSGTYSYETVEMRTVKLAPVYSDKPDAENKAFWDATPSGKIELGTINPGAWEPFALGAEFYVDFSPA